MKARAVSVVIHSDNVLLMRRNKSGAEYYTLPGGGVETGETPENACVRELYEETGLTGTLDRPLWTLENRGRTEHYFLVRAAPGEPQLGGPEAATNSPANAYRPMWVQLDSLPNINLVPTTIAARLHALRA